MIRVTIELDPQDIAGVRNMMSTIENGAERAIMRAANDTAVTARSRIVTTVAGRLHLLQRRVRQDTNIQRANLGYLIARAQVLGNPIPLAEYPHITSFIGTSVEVRRSRPAELWRHRFRAQMGTGHEGIFERRVVNGNPVGRLPIDEVYGPGVASVFHYNDELEVAAEMDELFAQRVYDRANYILSRSSIF